MTFPLILLTRPRADAEATAAELRTAIRAPLRARIVVAPVQEIVLVAAPLPDPEAVLILTSRHAVPQRGGAGRSAYCVGARTAEAARRSGLTVIGTAPDATALLVRLLADRPSRLVHLRGRHSAGDLVGRLRAGGLEACAIEVYRQESRRLPDEAVAALLAADRIVAPVYSPRSARILSEQWPAAAPPALVAISAAAARAWQAPAAPIRIAARPDGRSMREAILALLGSAAPC